MFTFYLIILDKRRAYLLDKSIFWDFGFCQLKTVDRQCDAGGCHL